MIQELEECRELLKKYGQEHLLRFYDEISPDEQSHLLASIRDIDFAKLSGSWSACQSELSGCVTKVDERLQPVPDEVCGSVQSSSDDELKRYYDIGLEQIANNRVACLLLAGGQGTRLGVSHPKGMYRLSLQSNRTLYEIQAGRIQKVCALASSQFGNGKQCRIPWYIMTSEHTQAETRQFFKEHNYFGMNPNDIRLFEQFTLPTLTLDGKCILESRSRISVAPDGNGGLYRALAHHKIVEELKSIGIEYLFVYCVDNILVKMADPHFIGFAVDRKVECANKVVEKTEPKEAVGVVGVLDGRYSVIEYSEITLETASKRRVDASNDRSSSSSSAPAFSRALLFNAGNICNHFFTVEFLERVMEKHADLLRYHVARKKVSYVDESGRVVEPATPNAIKLERFVFDVFPFVKDGGFAVWQVRREDEFAPLKNADAPNASDTPSTCRTALHYLNARQLLEAGASIAYRVDTNSSSGSDAGSNEAHPTGSISNGCEGNKRRKWRIADSDTLRDGSTLRQLCETNAIAVELDTSVSYFGEGLEGARDRLIVSPCFIQTPF